MPFKHLQRMTLKTFLQTLASQSMLLNRLHAMEKRPLASAAPTLHHVVLRLLCWELTRGKSRSGSLQSKSTDANSIFEDKNESDFLNARLALVLFHRSLKALLHILSSQGNSAVISGGTSKGVSKYYDGTLTGSPPAAATTFVSTFNVSFCKLLSICFLF